MREMSKSITRRLSDSNFIRKYFRGNGVDIGGKPDPLSLYTELFPLLESVKIWDREDGDAQFMADVVDDTFDFVTSSHCLEHLNDPLQGLRNWLRIIKPGGYLVLLVPDEDLYEQGQFPSTFNHDHKCTFTIWKETSWSERSFNVVDLIRQIGPTGRPEKIELLTATYRFELPRYDQTLTPVGEAAIEIIIRKVTHSEAQHGVKRGEQPPENLRRYYNQYQTDFSNMKRGNDDAPPFSNTSDI